MKTKRIYQKPTLDIVKYPSKPLLQSGMNSGNQAPRMNDDWASKGHQFGGWEEE